MRQLNANKTRNNTHFVQIHRVKLNTNTEELNMTTQEIIKQVIKERNEARAEVERLKLERDLWQQIQRDGATVNQQLTVRPEPSRLEIAAMLKAGWVANPDVFSRRDDDPAWWIEQADALIAAAKEGK
jgi:hypothetical protein